VDKGPHVPSKPPAHIMDAFKALEAGNANEFQQKAALDWLLREVCHTYDLSYRPGDSLATMFAEGRRSVGLEIVTMLKVNTTQIRQIEEKLNAKV